MRSPFIPHQTDEAYQFGAKCGRELAEKVGRIWGIVDFVKLSCGLNRLCSVREIEMLESLHLLLSKFPFDNTDKDFDYVDAVNKINCSFKKLCASSGNLGIFLKNALRTSATSAQDNSTAMNSNEGEERRNSDLGNLKNLEI